MAYAGYLKVREVAKMLRMSPRKIYDMIEQGRINVIRVGGSYRIPLAEAVKLVHESAPEGSEVETVRQNYLGNLLSELDLPGASIGWEEVDDSTIEGLAEAILKDAEGQFDRMYISSEDGLRLLRNLSLRGVLVGPGLAGGVLILRLFNLARHVTPLPFADAVRVDMSPHEWRGEVYSLHSLAARSVASVGEGGPILMVVEGINCGWCERIFSSPNWAKFLQAVESEIGRDRIIWTRLDTPGIEDYLPSGAGTPCLLFNDPYRGKTVIWVNGTGEYICPFIRTDLAEHFLYIDWNSPEIVKGVRDDDKWMEVFVYLFNKPPPGAAKAIMALPSVDEVARYLEVLAVQKGGKIGYMQAVNAVAKRFGIATNKARTLVALATKRTPSLVVEKAKGRMFIKMLEFEVPEEKEEEKAEKAEEEKSEEKGEEAEKAEAS